MLARIKKNWLHKFFFPLASGDVEVFLLLHPVLAVCHKPEPLPS